MSIEVLDAVNVARLPRLDGSPDPASCYIASLIKRGPASYVDNAKVRMEALVIDEKVLPLVISERVEGNSNVCSAYAHYFEYAFQELAKRYGRVPLVCSKRRARCSALCSGADQSTAWSSSTIGC